MNDSMIHTFYKNMNDTFQVGYFIKLLVHMNLIFHTHGSHMSQFHNSHMS